MSERARDIRIRLIYKSGAVMEFDCSEFTTKRNASGNVLSVEADNAWPKSIMFGLDEVAAIWRVDEPSAVTDLSDEREGLADE